MNHRFVWALAGTVLSGCRPDPAALRNALLDTDREFARASQVRRLDAWVDVFADSALLVRPNAPLTKGAAAVRESMGPAFADSTFSLNWEPVIAEVYRSDKVYSGPYATKGPDLIIGYHRGYRASWATTQGDLESDVISNNDSAWSADHCIAADQVPGVIFSNRPILRQAPTLIDLAPTILEQFAVSIPETMKGGSLFKPAVEGVTRAAGKE